MAVFDQPKTTYTDTTAQVRVITDLISLIDPMDTPFLAVFTPGGANGKFNFTAQGTKLEWLEDEFEPMADTLSASCTSDTVVLAVTDATAVQVGDALMIDAEYVIVKSISTNNVTVHSRSHGGTQATHAAAAVVYRVGQSRLEGADAEYGPITDITAPFNYTAIYQHARKVSGTANAIDQYGMGAELDYQADKMMPELFRMLDRSVYHSIRAAGSATTPRSMGGLPVFITDNSETSVGAIAAADFDALGDKIMGY
jgi:hypothetical protein